jgi:hypothetical protein
MFRTTKSHAVAALVAGAVMVIVPVAQADSGFTGSPDAIDRALAARQAETFAAIDARERGMTERPTLERIGSAPDAFERALIAHADAVRSETISMLDARERAQSTRPVASEPISSEPISSTGSFDWSDFGVGAGAGVGSMLVVLGLGAALLGARRQSGRMTTV